MVYHDPHHTIKEIHHAYHTLMAHIKDTNPNFNVRIVYSDQPTAKSLQQRDSYFNNAQYFTDFDQFYHTGLKAPSNPVQTLNQPK